jgi:hypothetical protein
VFDDLDFTLDDLRFKKSYCQEVDDHLVSFAFFCCQTSAVQLRDECIGQMVNIICSWGYG